MSEVAGRLSIQAGAWCLEKAHGGLGVLLGGVPGVEPAKVVIIGGGTVGFNAAQVAIGLGARVVVMDRGHIVACAPPEELLAKVSGDVISIDTSM